MTGPECRCWVEISRSRIAANFRAIRVLAGAEVTVAPVVKADAYGHGAVEVAGILAAEGAHWLAVSSVEEAVRLREVGIATRLLVMAGFLSYEVEAILHYALTPAVHDRLGLDALGATSKQRGVPATYHLKIDSGMGRLGIRASMDTIAKAVRGFPHLVLEGVMTHFASSSDYTGSQTEEQQNAFERICEDLRREGITWHLEHMASTTAIAYGRRQSWKNMIRPGHAVYGYTSPLRIAPAQHGPANLLNVSPALAWKARIVAVKEVEAGARIGYGGMFVSPAPMKIAIVGAGYADGIRHQLSNRGHMIAGGQFAPILGAVSMDVTTIDITHAPHLCPGDAVTLIGMDGEAHQDAQQMARAAGTISYDVLCGIGARVRRVYVD